MDTNDPDTVRAYLAASLPEWRLDGGRIVRSYDTGNWQKTMLLTGAISHLAETVGHHPDLEVTYPRLVVRLTTHDAGGVTAKDLELARLIEERATWKPGEGSAFAAKPGG